MTKNIWIWHLIKQESEKNQKDDLLGYLLYTQKPILEIVKTYRSIKELEILDNFEDFIRLKNKGKDISLFEKIELFEEDNSYVDSDKIKYIKLTKKGLKKLSKILNGDRLKNLTDGEWETLTNIRNDKKETNSNIINEELKKLNDELFIMRLIND